MRSRSTVIRKLVKLREEFQGTLEAPRSIYVLRISDDAMTDDRALKIRKFPSSDYPEIIDHPKGCVYVGVTSLEGGPEERFDIHKSKVRSAAKIAKLGYLSHESYEKCGKDLTDKFGFVDVGWRKNKDVKLESWLAWNFYLMGYWGWGAHYHEEEDFLGKGKYL